ncbi:MAG: fluoride efflux transporter CrcB [Proteobacteria bacterium]|nr:fluoride efflux transporter CrcB [Pseudomonadota bacterium]
MPTPLAIASVAAGAALGALLRWGLAAQLNPAWAGMPLGTLAANLLGGFGIGWLIAAPVMAPLAPELRLALATGFLGALTTFSTFSLEAFQMLLEGHVWRMAGLAGSHFFGSLGMTALGYWTGGGFSD